MGKRCATTVFGRNWTTLWACFQILRLVPSWTRFQCAALSVSEELLVASRLYFSHRLLQLESWSLAAVSSEDSLVKSTCNPIKCHRSLWGKPRRPHRMWIALVALSDVALPLCASQKKSRSLDDEFSPEIWFSDSSTLEQWHLMRNCEKTSFFWNSVWFVKNIWKSGLDCEHEICESKAFTYSGARSSAIGRSQIDCLRKALDDIGTLCDVRVSFKRFYSINLEFWEQVAKHSKHVTKHLATQICTNLLSSELGPRSPWLSCGWGIRCLHGFCGWWLLSCKQQTVTEIGT